MYTLVITADSAPNNTNNGTDAQKTAADYAPAGWWIALCIIECIPFFVCVLLCLYNFIAYMLLIRTERRNFRPDPQGRKKPGYVNTFTCLALGVAIASLSKIVDNLLSIASEAYWDEYALEQQRAVFGVIVRKCLRYLPTCCALSAYSVVIYAWLKATTNILVQISGRLRRMQQKAHIAYRIYHVILIASNVVFYGVVIIGKIIQYSTKQNNEKISDYASKAVAFWIVLFLLSITGGLFSAGTILLCILSRQYKKIKELKIRNLIIRITVFTMLSSAAYFATIIFIPVDLFVLKDEGFVHSFTVYNVLYLILFVVMIVFMWKQPASRKSSSNNNNKKKKQQLQEDEEETVSNSPSNNVTITPTVVELSPSSPSIPSELTTTTTTPEQEA